MAIAGRAAQLAGDLLAAALSTLDLDGEGVSADRRARLTADETTGNGDGQVAIRLYELLPEDHAVRTSCRPKKKGPGVSSRPSVGLALGAAVPVTGNYDVSRDTFCRPPLRTGLTPTDASEAR